MIPSKNMVVLSFFYRGLDEIPSKNRVVLLFFYRGLDEILSFKKKHFLLILFSIKAILLNKMR